MTETNANAAPQTPAPSLADAVAFAADVLAGAVIPGLYAAEAALCRQGAEVLRVLETPGLRAITVSAPECWPDCWDAQALMADRTRADGDGTTPMAALLALSEELPPMSTDALCRACHSVPATAGAPPGPSLETALTVACEQLAETHQTPPDYREQTYSTPDLPAEWRRYLLAAAAEREATHGE